MRKDAAAYVSLMSRLFAGTTLEQPATCGLCGKPIGVCICPRDALSGKVLHPADQAIRVRREQRRGKFVTVVTGFTARSARTDDLPSILKELKSKLATGGSLSGTTMELQGDHRDRLVEHFKNLGYPAKPAGG